MAGGTTSSRREGRQMSLVRTSAVVSHENETREGGGATRATGGPCGLPVATAPPSVPRCSPRGSPAFWLISSCSACVAFGRRADGAVVDGFEDAAGSGLGIGRGDEVSDEDITNHPNLFRRRAGAGFPPSGETGITTASRRSGARRPCTLDPPPNPAVCGEPTPNRARTAHASSSSSSSDSSSSASTAIAWT